MASADRGRVCSPATGGRTTTQVDEVVTTWTDLAQPRRWPLVPTIEETGRHAGHADIIRDRIDGSTGR